MLSTPRSLGPTLLVAMVVGCSEVPRHAEAEHLAIRFLGALAAPEGDRGWSLLLPDTQRTTFAGDREAYVALADAADWTTFRWSAATTEREETDAYAVELDIGMSELPHVVALITDFEDTDHPTILVRYGGSAGGGGIWSMNGMDFRGDRRGGQPP